MNVYMQMLRGLIVTEVRHDARLAVTGDDIRSDRLDDLQQSGSEIRAS